MFYFVITSITAVYSSHHYGILCGHLLHHDSILWRTVIKNFRMGSVCFTAMACVLNMVICIPSEEYL